MGTRFRIKRILEYCQKNGKIGDISSGIAELRVHLTIKRADFEAVFDTG